MEVRVFKSWVEVFSYPNLDPPSSKFSRETFPSLVDCFGEVMTKVMKFELTRGGKLLSWTGSQW